MLVKGHELSFITYIYRFYIYVPIFLCKHTKQSIFSSGSASSGVIQEVSPAPQRWLANSGVLHVSGRTALPV